MTIDICAQSGRSDAVHGYVAGTLIDPELGEFELHLLGCPRCEAAVREGLAVRSALRARAVAPHAEPPRRAYRRARVLKISLPLAAAAALAIAVFGRSDPLSRLGEIDRVPGFDALPVRSNPTEAARLTDAGMSAYAAGDYVEAARQLENAAAHMASPAVQFFLGIARLELNRNLEAADALGGALQPEGNAYESEAHFYLAKALLRTGRADSALTHLRAVSPGTSLASHAAALADSVTAVQSR